ncbi:MAG TPA: glycosyltransferase family 9 protein, partial [Ignavibacteria bacterium]
KKISDENKNAAILFFEGVLENEKSRKHNLNLPENVKKMQINFDLISACDIFISGDTGPLYLAEAFGVSTLSLFGPTSPYDYAPLNNSKNSVHRFIWKKPVCSPCHTSFTAIQRENRKFWKEGVFICYTGTHECMTSITIQEVKNMIDEMIEEVTALKNNLIK